MWQLYTGLVDCFGRCEVVRFLVINLGFIYTVVWLVMVGVAMVFVWTCAEQLIVTGNFGGEEHIFISRTGNSFASLG